VEYLLDHETELQRKKIDQDMHNPSSSYNTVDGDGMQLQFNLPSQPSFSAAPPFPQFTPPSSTQAQPNSFLTRRSSLPIPDQNEALVSRRHSFSFPPVQGSFDRRYTPMEAEPVNTAPQIHNSFSMPSDLSRHAVEPRRTQMNVEEDDEERVLVFDGLIRRRNGNNQPQDEYQIKFKLV
jgi:hypothetical protein